MILRPFCTTPKIPSHSDPIKFGGTRWENQRMNYCFRKQMRQSMSIYINPNRVNICFKSWIYAKCGDSLFICRRYHRSILGVIKPREKTNSLPGGSFWRSVFILTNQDGAKNFKIVSAPVSNPDVHHWKELIPHDETTLIWKLWNIQRSSRHIPMHKMRWTRSWSERGPMEWVILWILENHLRSILGRKFWNLIPQLRYRFNSFKTPMTVVDYDMKTR